MEAVAHAPATSAQETLFLENQSLVALHLTAMDLINRRDLPDLLDAILSRAIQLMTADYGWVYLVNAQEQVLELKARVGSYHPASGQKLVRGEGLAGRIWATGQALAVDDYNIWSGRSSKRPPQTAYAVAGVPLTVDEHVVGVLGVSLRKPGRTFGQQEISLLERFGQLAAAALENARLYEAAQRQARELELLDRVRTALAREMDLASLLGTIVEATGAAFGYRLVSLYLLCEGVLYLQHHKGYARIPETVPVSQGVIGRVIRTGTPALVLDVRSDPDYVGAVPDVESEICVPLFDQGHVVGVLNVESTEGPTLSQADLLLLTAISEHVSIAIERARLYKAARESERKYRSVVENSIEVIFQIDVDGNWRFLNYAWTEITGYSIAGSIGQPVLRFLHPDDHARATERWKRLSSAQETSCQCELRILTRAGDIRWIEIRVHVLPPLDGAPSGLSGIINDITERKLAEAELERQRDFALQVMNALGQGLVVTGPDGRIEYANAAAAEMTGFSAEDAIGKYPEDFVRPEDRDLIADGRLQRDAGMTTTATLELNALKADGAFLPVLVTETPRLRDGKIIGSIVLLTDLTERKRLENSLAQARDDALAASRAKSEFLATMSHEIRTPLNSIIGMNELLLGTTLTPGQHEYAMAVQTSSEGLLAIVDEILDFSKVEAGKLTLEKIDFEPATIIEQTIAMLVARTQAKRLRLNSVIAPDVPMQVAGDPDRLRQILINLVSNAVKFTEQGSIEVRMTVEDVAEDGLTLRFVVSDTGIGMSEATRRRIFEPFTQADGSMTRRYGGAGLGLAISKRLVELMGGQIGVESEAGSGSSFWFTARFTPVASAASPGLGRQPLGDPAPEIGWPSDQHPLILLAEDDPVNQRLAVLQLERSGYAVHAVADGRAAITALGADPTAYALVLMDCQMPEMDGFAAARAIRASELGSGRRVPIVAMTANVMRGAAEACIEAGMDDYISKPVHYANLKQVLLRWAPAPPNAPAAPMPSAEAISAGGPSHADTNAFISAAALSSGAVPSGREPATSTLDAATIAGLWELEAEGPPGVFDELVRLFFDNAAAYLSSVESAIVQGDSEALFQAGHGLKGSAGTLGALRLERLGAHLEALGSSGQTDGAQVLLNKARDELYAVRQAVAAVPAAMPHAPTS
jgi:two-component system sensor histidine kinase/response regulator